MTLDQLLAELERLLDMQVGEEERAHQLADALLLRYINDPRVTDLFLKIPKFY